MEGYGARRRRRPRSSEDIAWTARLIGGAVALVGATGGLVSAVGGAREAAITFAVAGILGAAAAIALTLLQRKAETREEQEAILRRPPARVAEVAAAGDFYKIGVETESPAALAELGLSDASHPPYLPRDVDGELRRRLQAASQRAGSTLVVVAGHSKAGKSRTLAEALVAELPDAWLVAPSGKDPGGALTTLVRDGPPKELRSTEDACVIWLDDIEPFAAGPGPGLSSEGLDALDRWGRPVVVAGTAGGKGQRVAVRAFEDAVSDLLRRHQPVRLDMDLSELEQSRLEIDADVRSIGEFMISADELINRYEHGSSGPEGRAVARAAIDWRRVGLVRPIPEEALERLSRLYLDGQMDPDRFRKGLEWATEPLYAHVALLSGRGPYEPYDYLASHERGPIPESMWEALIGDYATAWELHLVGIAAHEAGHPEIAERAFARGDAREDAGAAYNLAVLFELRGDLDAAAAARARGVRHAKKAISRGETIARRNHLGLARSFEEDGDLQFAIVAYRSAAASNESDVAAAARDALARLEGA